MDQTKTGVKHHPGHDQSTNLPKLSTCLTNIETNLTATAMAQRPCKDPWIQNAKSAN